MKENLKEIAASIGFHRQPGGSKAQTFDRYDARTADDALFAGEFNSLVTRPGEALIVTDKNCHIQWVNPAFTAMSGFSLREVKGRKPSAILQGKLTDPESVQRMRDAIHSHKPWTEEVVNYKKDGTPYWVSISISPVLDGNLQARCFVAVSHEIKGRPLPA